MEKASSFQAKRHVAVVTGANKGIGYEVCKQLASNGVTVVLTSRDETKGLEAVEKLKQSKGLSDFIIFHRLDVVDLASLASLATFIRTQFGKLDVLVNNAAVSGVTVDPDALRKASQIAGDWPEGDQFNWKEIAPQNYEQAEECLKTNYYGTKRVIESCLPLLQLSDSPRIVNVSSHAGMLARIPDAGIRAVFDDIETLTEEKVDQILHEFLKDFREDNLRSKGWPTSISAYRLSKVALNAYTRILARKHPDMRINAVAPGYVKTDMTGNNGLMTADAGAQPIVRVALMDNGAPSSGLFFYRNEALTHF